MAGVKQGSGDHNEARGHIINNDPLIGERFDDRRKLTILFLFVCF